MLQKDLEERSLIYEFLIQDRLEHVKMLLEKNHLQEIKDRKERGNGWWSKTPKEIESDGTHIIPF